MGALIRQGPIHPDPSGRSGPIRRVSPLHGWKRFVVLDDSDNLLVVDAETKSVVTKSCDDDSEDDALIVDAFAVVPGSRCILDVRGVTFGLWDGADLRSPKKLFPRHGMDAYPAKGNQRAGAEALVWALSVHPDGRRFATLDDRGRIELWDLEKETLLHSWAVPASSRGAFPRKLITDPIGAKLFTYGDLTDCVWEWDWATGAGRKATHIGTPELDVHPDGRLLLAEGLALLVLAPKADLDEERQFELFHPDTVRCTTLACLGTEHVIAGYELQKDLILFSLRSGKRLAIEHVELPIGQVFALDETHFAVTSYDSGAVEVFGLGPS